MHPRRLRPQKPRLLWHQPAAAHARGLRHHASASTSTAASAAASASAAKAGRSARVHRHEPARAPTWEPRHLRLHPACTARRGKGGGRSEAGRLGLKERVVALSLRLGLLGLLLLLLLGETGLLTLHALHPHPAHAHAHSAAYRWSVPRLHRLHRLLLLLLLKARLLARQECRVALPAEAVLLLRLAAVAGIIVLHLACLPFSRYRVGNRTAEQDEKSSKGRSDVGIDVRLYR